MTHKLAFAYLRLHNAKLGTNGDPNVDVVVTQCEQTRENFAFGCQLSNVVFMRPSLLFQLLRLILQLAGRLKDVASQRPLNFVDTDFGMFRSKVYKPLLDITPSIV